MTSKGIGIGLPAPDFELEGYDNRTYTLSSYRGKAVLLVFMRESRKPETAHQLEQLYKLNHTISHWTQILVVVEEDPGRKSARQVRNYFDQYPAPFPVLQDPDNALLKRYNVYETVGLVGFQVAHSSLFLLNSQLEVVYDYVGEHPFENPNLEVLMTELQKLYATRPHA